jgi:hypothetical protein
MFLLAFLFACSVSAVYQTTSFYDGEGCDSGDTIVFLTTSGSLCTAVSCLSGGGASTDIKCSDSAPDMPGGLAGYTLYSQSNCQGDIDALFGYTTACVAAGPVSYSANCASNGGLSVATYNNGDCSGTPTTSDTYTFGCTSEGGISIEQTACEESDRTVDWKGYLRNFLREVNQGWNVPSFSTTVFYSSHGTWTNTDTSASCTITFTGSVENSDIDDFVGRVCDDMLLQANAGVCDQASETECLSNPDSVTITCTWSASAKRQSSASAIDFNAEMSSGFALTGLFALCLSLLVLLF